MAHDVTFIPGDGTGPELAEATRRVLEATGVDFNWDRHEAGIDEYEKHGNPFPEVTLTSLKTTGVGIKGPTTTPVGSGFRSVNVLLRKELDLYACIRPCKSYEGVRTRFPETDLVIVRENTEDLYAGIEFERGTADNASLREKLADLGATVREDAGISIKPISEFGSERIVRSAFEYAIAHGRPKVTAAHKANIMKFSDGVFLEVARRVALDYPDVDFEDRIIDNLCNQLVMHPEEYHVVVLPNLYGDIVSDLCAGMIGGLGLAGGANIGTQAAVFEATHGSAPKYAGQNRMNPTALMLSGVYMLDYLEEVEAARAMEDAIAAVIRKGEKVTYDLKPSRTDPTAVGTSQFADAVIEEMNA
jgi:isocitrate dehydrogenase (NAD+)